MNFFPDAATNDAFTVWKQQALEATSHGWLYSDTYLLQVFTEGVDAQQVAVTADWDWEEQQFMEDQEAEADLNDDPERFSLYPLEG